MRSDIVKGNYLCELVSLSPYDEDLELPVGER